MSDIGEKWMAPAAVNAIMGGGGGVIDLRLAACVMGNKQLQVTGALCNYVMDYSR